MTETSHSKTQKDVSPAHVKGKKRDRSASEERLIQAGLEVFSKHGFNGATTKEIAKKADVNESLIGRYFDGKEGLLVAIIERFIEEVVQEALPYEPQETLADELEHYVKNRVNQGCMHEDFARIVFSQALVDKKFKRRVRETIPLQIDPHLVERVTRLANAGKLNLGTITIEEICQQIDTYMDGVFFFDRILHEETNDNMIAKTVRFMRLYARLFDKK
ncbi:TetR/AcrR family transcriptional regulator [Bdellovibrio sp. 22V]|uniref:TetR/AcrR family transcriptional regulator n=1 Tax=Bdellovibrio TaxID=958 RepID=UPI00254295D9|nr:TetR/AcrR family transcriptional regulator [Bdellovibrio sp. 22V]WII73183.1 TetR/AcrR family transcriptional regulator [Bdellovibrio sp. 22V]